MELEPGTTLLHYRIDKKIGEGGMGVVWKAHDTTLDRDVAIKVLPQTLAADGDRLARFEREAKILAALNHPNISAVYGFHEDRDLHFLVMEYVPGEDLGETIARGALSLEPALRLALQIIDALEAAHSQGIVHRDLKPANVRITPEGQVKVLDLGLAKAFESEADRSNVSNSLSPTMTSTGTVAGVLLGTAAYMSPEQARGHPADQRSDVWAFGATLFEMLTGERPFDGETISDTLAAILKLEPDWTRIEAHTNPPLERLMQRCLAKKKSRRLHHIADVRLELLEAQAYDPGETADVPTPALAPTWQRLLPWSLALVLAVVAIAGMLPGRAPDVAANVLSLVAPLPTETYLRDEQEGAIAISPNGTVLVFVGEPGDEQSLFVQRLEMPEPIRLAGTEGASSPFFSPDSRWIAFFDDSEGKLRKVSIDGGAPLAICDYPGPNRGGTWSDDGQIYFTPEFASGLWQVSDAGGTPTPLTEPDVDRLERTHRWPQAVRGHDLVIFTVGDEKSPENYDNARIDAVRPSTGARFTIFKGASFARYLPTGHLLLGRQGYLFAAPVDIDMVKLLGQPVPVLEGVRGARNSGVVHASVSDNGILSYVPGERNKRLYRMAWRMPDGSDEFIDTPARGYLNPAISPDGTRIAVGISGDERFDIWVYDIAAGTLTKLTFEGDNYAPVWSPDGEWIAFTSTRSGKQAIFVKSSAGVSQAREVFSGQDPPGFLNDFSRDGRALLIEIVSSPTRSKIARIQLEGGPQPEVLVQGPGGYSSATYSPDGRWLVYESDESGQPEIYVHSLDEGGERAQVSVDGGVQPIWTRDGGIFYARGGQVLAAEIETVPRLRIGRRRIVAENAHSDTLDGRFYTVSYDGKKLLLVLPEENVEARPDSIRIVTGWTDRMVRDLPHP